MSTSETALLQQLGAPELRRLLAEQLTRRKLGLAWERDTKRRRPRPTSPSSASRACSRERQRQQPKPVPHAVAQVACNTGEMRGRLARAMYAFQRQGAMKKLVEANVQAWRTAK